MDGGRKKERQVWLDIEKLYEMRENSSLCRTHSQNCSSFGTTAPPINAGGTIQAIIMTTTTTKKSPQISRAPVVEML